MSDQGPRVKNGPALAGHGAEAVRDAIAGAITTLPVQLRQSLTWIRAPRWPSTRSCGSRPACRSTSAIPTARGSAVPTRHEGLLRQYFPEGTDLSRHSADDLAAVAATLNAAPARRSTGERPPRRRTSTSASGRTGTGLQAVSTTAKSALVAGDRRRHAAIAAPARPSGPASATTAASPQPSLNRSQTEPRHPPRGTATSTGTVARTG